VSSGDVAGAVDQVGVVFGIFVPYEGLEVGGIATVVRVHLRNSLCKEPTRLTPVHTGQIQTYVKHSTPHKPCQLENYVF